MKPLIASALLLIVLATILASTTANSDQGDTSNAPEESKSKFGLPNPFDFLNFKKFYHKEYDSPVEESSRMKMFLARCYQVFVSAVSYFHGRRKYFLRINDRADWTPEELEDSKNKFTISSMLQASGELKVDENGKAKRQIEPDEDEVFEDSLEEFEEDPLVGPEELADELKEIRLKSDREPELKLLAQGLDKLNSAGLKRQKRNTYGTRSNFKIEQAFDLKPPGESRGGAVIKRRVVTRDESEARSYKNLPVKGNHKKRGFVSAVTRMFLTPASKVGEQIESIHSGKSSGSTGPVNADDGGDIVWVDHRKGDCMPPIRNQGTCGSCYAFAALAFIEWLHCSTTGEQLRFSEQYMVDCGPPNQPGVNGCKGSNFYRAAEFITNFGLELRDSYKYTGAPNECPYEPSKKREEFGFYRADVSDVLTVNLKFAELYLDKWPILVEMHATGDFTYYGGGVWDGKGCKRKSDHCVMMVGHGREDGEEYWLIRNSFGPGWGENGYMKLNKNSNCIFLPQGYILGTVDGKESVLSVQRNKHLSKPIEPKLSAVSSIFAKSKIIQNLYAY